MDTLTWLGIGLASVAAILSVLSISFIMLLVIGQFGYQIYQKLVT